MKESPLLLIVISGFLPGLTFATPTLQWTISWSPPLSPSFFSLILKKPLVSRYSYKYVSVNLIRWSNLTFSSPVEPPSLIGIGRSSYRLWSGVLFGYYPGCQGCLSKSCWAAWLSTFPVLSPSLSSSHSLILCLSSPSEPSPVIA